MGPRFARALGSLAGISSVAASLAGCGTDESATSLSKSASNEIPKVPVPSEHGPKLASVADLTPVLERPAVGARAIGYLHAGSRVSRAEEPHSRAGCAQGFYPVRPAGFVCAEGSATVDLTHPTLAAMAIQPLLDQALPYAYARTTRETPLYERDPSHESAVREIGKLKRRAGMAVVGSWTAAPPGGAAERLALLTSGRFAKAADLEAAKPSEFVGVELGQKRGLPVAFVVKRGVRRFELDGEAAEKAKELDYHALLPLSGRFRTAHGEKFWALEGKSWVRHKDVTVIQPRSVFPDFAVEGQKWLDVSVVTETLVAYEGKRPFFATLVSVTRDPTHGAAALAEGEVASAAPSAAWGLGTFEVRAKHVTRVGADPFAPRESYQLYDLPWALELASGRLLHGAYWHDRFGVEHGSGSIELSPSDAVRIFQWATPNLPEGWHSSNFLGNERKTLVVLRK